MKAIGVGGKVGDFDPPGSFTDDGDCTWYPLDSNRESFIIMTELGIQLFFGEQTVSWVGGDDILVESFPLNHRPSKQQATRRLIVRVADHIWRNKNVQGS